MGIGAVFAVRDPEVNSTGVARPAQIRLREPRAARWLPIQSGRSAPQISLPGKPGDPVGASGDPVGASGDPVCANADCSCGMVAAVDRVGAGGGRGDRVVAGDGRVGATDGFRDPVFGTHGDTPWRAFTCAHSILCRSAGTRVTRGRARSGRSEPGRSRNRHHKISARPQIA